MPAMPNPYERMAYKAFYRRWATRAWQSTLKFERRWGLLLNFALAAFSALFYWVLRNPDVNVLGVIAAALLAVFLLLLIVFFVYALSAPPRLALEQAREESGSDTEDLMYSLSMGEGPDAPWILTFPTRPLTNAILDTQRKVTALRFLHPVDRIIRTEELPTEIWIPWRRGKIVVKRFTERGVLLDCVNTTGVHVRAEVYL